MVECIIRDATNVVDSQFYFVSVDLQYNHLSLKKIIELYKERGSLLGFC